MPAEEVAAATPAGLPAEEAVAAPVPAEEATAAAPAMPPQPDDLTIMEGIGPKIASVLAAAGVTTFAQLAAADVDWLREVMLAAGLRLADPTTWPEQSRLAAAGDWEGLKELQGQLKGGRRVK
jgi:predicted flap endonuclease-1-like 5' DNA nuclease